MRDEAAGGQEFLPSPPCPSTHRLPSHSFFHPPLPSVPVAAALTDLAVLHMEAGDDSVGRPLLARAHAIQTVALGADHPDVAAIRDVLDCT